MMKVRTVLSFLFPKNRSTCEVKTESQNQVKTGGSLKMKYDYEKLGEEVFREGSFWTFWSSQRGVKPMKG